LSFHGYTFNFFLLNNAVQEVYNAVPESNDLFFNRIPFFQATTVSGFDTTGIRF